ncbi:5'-adenylylsulfate reductase-like 3 [Curcuma longa]|uniref:5'-adenylylsulfate reductase-like 3 n=1 Tax=Curcuma longa TaxID=136217 RepID=UPI003D9F153B
MEGTGKLTQILSSSLLFLVSFVVLAMGSPACPVPSVGDSILGRSGSRWDLDPRMVHANYPIGVVEGDEAALQRAFSIVQTNRDSYVALLFYASWCPFSKVFRPNFHILSDWFPAVHHFAFEESVIRPSILSKHGVHGFPTILLLNSTMIVRYRGPRNKNSLVAFYNHVTGVDPSAKLIPLDEIMDSPRVSESMEDAHENCPFSWAKSPEKLLQQDGYLALASCFLLMRLLHRFLPSLNACFQRAWRRQMRYASLRNIWNSFKACLEQAKQGFSRLYPLKQSNLQEGAMNAKAWASKSLASVSLGESSSGRAYSTVKRN